MFLGSVPPGSGVAHRWVLVHRVEALINNCLAIRRLRGWRQGGSRLAVDTTVGDMSQGNNKDNLAGKPRNQEVGASERGAEDRRGRHSPAGADQTDRARAGAMEVVVSHNIEKAMKILKRKLIKEGLFKELKARRYFEKPSVRKKRKEKEARKKQRKDEARLRKGPGVM